MTDPKEKEFIGATAHTNNTGELTAMHKALSDALMRPAGGGREIIWSDSLYTINMTTGRWRPRCPRNREIVASTRGLWRRLQRQRDTEVELRHVRSHTRVPGNELADWLAEIGRMEGGRPVSAASRTSRWLVRRAPSRSVAFVGAHLGARPRGRGARGARVRACRARPLPVVLEAPSPYVTRRSLITRHVPEFVACA